MAFAHRSRVLRWLHDLLQLCFRELVLDRTGAVAAGGSELSFQQRSRAGGGVSRDGFGAATVKSGHGGPSHSLLERSRPVAAEASLSGNPEFLAEGECRERGGVPRRRRIHRARTSA